MSLGKIIGHNDFALKLDLCKTFDRVEWNYLESIMLAMRFSPNLVSLILRCIRSVSFSILINGSPSLSFTLTKGSHKGDPFSPYVFIICAEGLSSMIRFAKRQALFSGLRFRHNTPFITHLFFANDSIIFCKASIEHT